MCARAQKTCRFLFYNSGIRSVMKCLIKTSMLLLSLKVLGRTFASVRKLAYQAIPDHLTLHSVVVIHRHGDRSQISKSLGPKYPEHDSITEAWRNTMPTEDMKRLMLSVAVNAEHKIKEFPNSDLIHTHTHDDIDSILYSGYDHAHIPYGQLTSLGCEQMVHVGHTLRVRYGKHVPIHKGAGKMYLRSSNYCRTMQSLRCLLVGLFDAHIPDTSHTPTPPILPCIHTIHTKADEVIYPPSILPPYMQARKNIIYPPHILHQSIHDYKAIHDTYVSITGYAHIPWLTIKEVLTAHTIHKIKHVDGVCDDHLQKIDEMAAFIWGVLYKVWYTDSINIHTHTHTHSHSHRTRSSTPSLSVALYTSCWRT